MIHLLHDERSNTDNLEFTSMALISRRRLAQSLERVATFVPDQTKLKDWVSRLDKVRDDYVATEWELILLESFSKQGAVKYEPRPDQRVDIIFDDAKVAFAADITTASDRFLHQKNPVHQFSEELGRQARKNRILEFGGFSYEIWIDQPVLTRDQHRSPLLPHVSGFREKIFNRNWIEFIRMVRENLTTQHTYYAFVGKSKIKISYSPSFKGHTLGSFGSYTGANVLTENPLYNSLYNKARKLRRSSYSGPIGIIVCDGGCSMLTAKPSWETYTIPQIITKFFHDHRSIDFIGIVAVAPRLSVSWPRTPQYDYSPQFYSRSDRQIDYVGISDVFHRSIGELPAIKTMPSNVIHSLNWRRPNAPYRPYLGGWTCSESALTLSARELLEVISGKMPHHLFYKNHLVGNGSNSFVIRLAKGNQITGITLRKQSDEDDDLVTLKFGRKQNEESRSIQPKDGIPEQAICVDAQTLLYFLAGTIKFTEFSHLTEAPSRFLKHLEAGELFSDLKVCKGKEEATVAFIFGETDPAIAPFRQALALLS